MQIETLAVDALIPYARNSRTHSDAQVAQIAASIREFGFTNPVLIDADGGIIAGHGRVMAARQLGLAEVPCLRLPHLTEAQKRAYIIADNAIALNSGWDDDLLKAELKWLDRAGVEFDTLGLTDEFLTELFDPGQMKKSFDRGAIHDGGDEEPESRNAGKYPVTVILDELEYSQWDALKDRKGLSDKRLLLHLMEGK